MNTPDAIMILSRDEPQHVIAANGSGSWKINIAKRAEAVRWLILANKVDGKRRLTLLGKVVGFELDKGGDNPGRYAVKIDAFCDLSGHGKSFDGKSSNPVQFVDAEQVLEFNPESCELLPVPKQSLRQSYERPGAMASRTPPKPLSITEAKAGLAATFGIEPEQVEIIIKA